MASSQEKLPLLLLSPKYNSKHEFPAPDEPQVDLRAEFTSLASMALQVSLSTFARIALTSVDYAFLGHLGTTELAAASLSSVWTTVPLMLVWGACGALTTLCGQAWGAKNGELMGVWLQMGLVMVTICTLPLFVCFWNVEYVLVLSTTDPEIIRLGVRFARVMSFASWPALVYVCLRLYFQSMSVMTPVTVVGTVSIGVAVTANYFLIYGCFGWSGLGFDGSPLATVIASWFQPIALFSYCVLYKKMHLVAWGGWDLEALTVDRIKTYANLAFPIAINVVIADVASSGLALIAAKLSSEAIAANAVISGLWLLLWAVFWGFGCATQIRVANCLGANRPQAAKALAKLGLLCTLLCVALLATVTFSLREAFFQIYTTDAELLTLCMLVQPLFIVGFMIEAVEMLTSSVLNAMGEAAIVAWTSSITTWCIELPLAYVGAITFGYGFSALWVSICTIEVIRLAVYWTKLARVDWNRMAHNAMENMEVADKAELDLEQDV